jgi:proline dehydrogenase
MSVKWDDIDFRHQKSQKDAKELKDFLIKQQEEKKMRQVLKIYKGRGWRSKMIDSRSFTRSKK